MCSYVCVRVYVCAYVDVLLTTSCFVLFLSLSFSPHSSTLAPVSCRIYRRHWHIHYLPLDSSFFSKCFHRKKKLDSTCSTIIITSSSSSYAVVVVFVVVWCLCSMVVIPIIIIIMVVVVCGGRVCYWPLLSHWKSNN